MMRHFSFTKTALEGACIVTPFYANDERGGFIKDYNVDIFQSNGIDHELKEVFYTLSHKGVLRAIHFQKLKQQAKLVRCIKGRIYDVIVDLRCGSKTFGNWQGFELTEDNQLSIYVPEHFGHGYLVQEESIVSYQCSEVFYGEYDSGIRWNDPDIGIEWPLHSVGGEKALILSEKDRNLQSFTDFRESTLCPSRHPRTHPASSNVENATTA